MDTPYREMAEARLTGHTGTDPWAVAGVCSVIVSAPVLREALGCVVPQEGRAAAFFDRIFFPAAVIAAVQLPLWVALTAASLSAGIAFQKSFADPTAPKSTADDCPDEKEHKKAEGTQYLPCLVPFRALLMLLTCYCILAVDFRVFPAGAMKTELYGFSLMDLGVGAFVFSHGISMGDRILDHSHWDGRPTGISYPSPSVADRVAAKWVRTSFPLACLGLARVILIKSLNYQEHVTEYGVHWNFFFTLALLPLLYYPLRHVRPAVIVLLCIGGHQAWLNSGGTDYIQSDIRDSLLDMNKEGLFSLPGYMSLFVLGCVYRGVLESGHTWNHHNPNKAFVAVCCGVSWACHVFLQPCSRRLCNPAYIFFVAGLCAGVLLALVHLSEATCCASAYLSRVSHRGLYVFLVANLLTGLTNISLHTLEADDTTAHAVLFAYLTVAPQLPLLLDETWW